MANIVKRATGLAIVLAALLGQSAIAREITHSMGITEVPDRPQRVVVLTNEGTEAALSLGITPIGAANSWNGDPWWDHIKARMGGTTPVGKENAINLELVASLQPDLILGTKPRHEEIYPQLSAIAPTVMSEDLRGDWRANFQLYAKALGRMDEGRSVLADFDAAVADLRTRLGDAVTESVSVVRFLPGQIRIYQLDSFSGTLLEKIGFKRPAIQDVDAFAIRTGKESIPEMDGDRIFYFTWDVGNGEGAALTQEVVNDPLWRSLSAVSTGQVHAVSDAIWNTAGGIIAARLMLKDIARIYEVD
ncbi:MAG: ABC transporter substrate-binding protein [Roseovarius sp.]